MAPPSGPAPNRPFACSHCENQFYTRQEHLDRHVAAKHSNGVKEFACSLCPKRFARRDIRGRHEQAHWKKQANEAGKSVAKTAAKGKARPTKKRAASETYDDEDDEDSPPAKVLRTSKACDRCSKSKLRCDGEEDTGPCGRCTRSSLSCTFRRPITRKQSSRSESSEGEEENFDALDGGDDDASPAEYDEDEDYAPEDEQVGKDWQAKMLKDRRTVSQYPPYESWRAPQAPMPNYATFTAQNYQNGGPAGPTGSAGSAGPYDAFNPIPRQPEQSFPAGFSNLSYLSTLQPFFAPPSYGPATENYYNETGFNNPSLTGPYVQSPSASAITNPFANIPPPPQEPVLEAYASGTRANVYRSSASAAESLLSLAGFRAES